MITDSKKKDESDVQRKINIRIFKNADREAVFELHKAAMSKNPGGYIPGYDNDLNSIPETYINGRRGTFLVGEYKGEIVAMGALLQVDNNTAEVKRIRISPTMQGKGLGQKMLAALENEAKSLGYKRLTLDTLKTTTSAVNLFKGNGYTEIGTSLFLGQVQLLFEKKLPDNK